MEQLTITLGTTIAATGKIKELNIFCSIARFVPLFLYIAAFSCGGAPYWQMIIVLINFGIVINAFTIYQCKKYCGLSVSVFCKAVLYPCCFCSIFAFLIGSIPSLFMEEGWIRLVLSTTVTLLVYVLSTYFVGFNAEEKQLIHSLTSKLINKIKR